MNRSDLPLLLASDLMGSDDERYPLDRVRMQKAVFLAVQRGPEAWHDFYSYQPYDWGPYSRTLTSDLAALDDEGLLQTRTQRPAARYGRFATTAEGEKRGGLVLQELSPREAQFLRTIRSYVTSKSFESLLREVYAAYPAFATESRFRPSERLPVTVTVAIGLVCTDGVGFGSGQHGELGPGGGRNDQSPFDVVGTRHLDGCGIAVCP